MTISKRQPYVDFNAGDITFLAKMVEKFAENINKLFANNEIQRNATKCQMLFSTLCKLG